MEIVNLTSHAINVLSSDGSVVANLPPSGEVARVATAMRKVGVAGDIDLYAQEVGEVVGLPTPKEGTLFIVSALVRLAHPERKDLASPGELVRNSAGQPVGCRGLVINR